MNKLFGLFLLALAFLTPVSADAATCFWVGGTATWDNVNTGGGGAGGIKWASASGGGTACAAVSGPAAGVPGPSDSATCDASSGAGTITVSGATISVTNITTNLCSMTVNWGTNAVTLSGLFSNTGAGTRTIDMGSGTWTFTGTGTLLDNTTQTNCTSCVYSNATLVFSGNNNNRTINGGALTYGAMTINNNSTPGDFNILQGNTFASLTVGSGVTLLFQQAATTTISGALNVTGTSSAPSSVFSASNGNIATITVGAASTVQWAAIHRITETAGGSSITATNSFDLGVNTNISISPPSAAGSGGGRIIGG